MAIENVSDRKKRRREEKKALLTLGNSNHSSKSFGMISNHLENEMEIRIYSTTKELAVNRQSSLHERERGRWGGRTVK